MQYPGVEIPQAVAEAGISVGQPLDAGHRGQLDVRQVFLPQFPYDLSLNIDLDDAFPMAGADECVSVFKADRGKDQRARRLNLVLPKNLSRAVVFTHLAIAIVGNEIYTFSVFPEKPGVAMFVEVVKGELYGVFKLALGIDFDRTAGPGFGDEGVAVFKSLEGMYLQRNALIAVGICGVIFSDSCALGVDLNNLGPVCLA